MAGIRFNKRSFFLPSDDKNPSGTLIVEGSKASINLLECTNFCQKDSNNIFLALGAAVPKPLEVQARIRIHYFVDKLTSLVVNDSIKLSMNQTLWGAKKLLIQEVSARDKSHVSLINVCAENKMVVSAQHESNIICAGFAPEIILIGCDNATMDSTQLQANTVQAIASEKSVITALVAGATFIAKSQKTSQINYLGDPISFITNSADTIQKK